MCHKVVTYPVKDKDGKPVLNEDKTPKQGEFYEFHFLDTPDVNFTVNQSKYFTAVDGGHYVPVIGVYLKPYVGKDGKAYNRNALVVNWEVFN